MRELERLADVLRDDVNALDCRTEFDGWRAILSVGTAADQQIALYDIARVSDMLRIAALREMMSWLVAKTVAATDLPGGEAIRQRNRLRYRNARRVHCVAYLPGQTLLQSTMIRLSFWCSITEHRDDNVGNLKRLCRRYHNPATAI